MTIDASLAKSERQSLVVWATLFPLVGLLTTLWTFAMWRWLETSLLVALVLWAVSIPLGLWLVLRACVRPLLRLLSGTAGGRALPPHADEAP